MPDMMKPKQWLFDNGFISQIKQGRISRENKARIEKAITDDPTLMIEGYSRVSTPTPAGKDNTTNKGTDKTTPTNGGSDTKPKGEPAFKDMDIPNTVRDEKYWQAHALVEGKRVPKGMKDICNVCNSSFTYCHCQNPTTYVYPDVSNSHYVFFSPK